MWIRTAVLSLTTAAITLTGAGISAAAADLGPPTQTAPVTAGPTGPGPALLTGVRVGRHDTYDRTVFDFTGGTPGYRVEYAPLYTEGRGEDFSVDVGGMDDTPGLDRAVTIHGGWHMRERSSIPPLLSAHLPQARARPLLMIHV